MLSSQASFVRRSFTATTTARMVKIVVGMMGSSVAAGSTSMADSGQVKEFLSVVKSHKVKELDTARVYAGGKSEELLGSVDASKDFAVSTKAPAFMPGSLTADKIITNCNKSLEALKQDKVDIYYLHGPDRQTPLEEQCRAIGRLYKEGKFERFGISNLSPMEVQTIHDICEREGYVLPSVYQGAFNPIHRAAEFHLFPLLRKLSMNFYVFSPLAGGFFAKKLEDIKNPTKGSRFDAMKVFGDIYLNDSSVKALSRLTESCQRHDISVMEATMRWFMHHTALNEEDAVILGASTSNQIDASLDACGKGPLPRDVLDEFHDMWESTKAQAPAYHV